MVPHVYSTIWHLVATFLYESRPADPALLLAGGHTPLPKAWCPEMSRTLQSKNIQAEASVSADTDTTHFYWVISDDWEGLFLYYFCTVLFLGKILLIIPLSIILSCNWHLLFPLCSISSVLCLNLLGFLLAASWSTNKQAEWFSLMKHLQRRFLNPAPFTSIFTCLQSSSSSLALMVCCCTSLHVTDSSCWSVQQCETGSRMWITCLHAQYKQGPTHENSSLCNTTGGL